MTYITIDLIAGLRSPDGDPPCSRGLEAAREWLLARAPRTGRVRMDAAALRSAHAVGLEARWVARAQGLPRDWHAVLVADADWDVRWRMAQRVDLAAEHHAALVADANWYVRRAMAERADLAAEYHAALVADADGDVRAARSGGAA